MDKKERKNRDILVVDDDPVVGKLISVYIRDFGFSGIEAVDCAADGLSLLNEFDFKLIFLDLGLPDAKEEEVLSIFLEKARKIPVVVVTGDNQVQTAVRCMKEGAFDFLGKPITPPRLMSILSHGQKYSTLRQLWEPDLKEKVSPVFSPIITRDPQMFSIFHAIERFAPSPLPVLIKGASGTGKELIARAIHDLSGRPGDFVPVNVAGLDRQLFSDMLFGHVKGAYTGADSVRPGLVKQANQGTLFLDEIGDLNIDVQVKLLRFLQEGEFYPIGSDHSEKSFCRILFATNADLPKAVREGRFRTDLYYRLSVHMVRLPSLKERGGDIELLCEHFAKSAAKLLNLDKYRIDPSLIGAFGEYDFPGNIRELSAIIQGLLTSSDDGTIGEADFKSYLKKNNLSGESQGETLTGGYGNSDFGEELPTLEEMERRLIKEALRRTDNRQEAAAKLLGISQPTISRKIRDIPELLIHNE